MKHIHLDAIGGIAGDMFIAAVLDACPHLGPGLLRVLADPVLLPASVRTGIRPFNDGILQGSRFEVEGAVPPASGHGDGHHHSHTHFSRIRQDLVRSALTDDVRATAVEIFQILAEAEAAVHGSTPDDVAFHEVGALDSIADIVGAAWLIRQLQGSSWSVSALPPGSGTVETAHGRLPVPAPAVMRLLAGFDLRDDGLPGERITPTGAAILRYLQPVVKPTATLRITACGYGFGTKRFPGISNVLRLTVLEAPAETGPILRDEIIRFSFEVDDQTPEDLAVGLENIRNQPGVLEVMHSPAMGKKGRFTQQIQVLARPESADGVASACFTETTTLGLREETIRRRILPRKENVQPAETGLLRVKSVTRPDGTRTAKTDMDDVAGAGGFARRNGLRFRAEQIALAPDMTSEEASDE